jgi:hypothetical protein
MKDNDVVEGKNGREMKRMEENGRMDIWLSVEENIN